VIVIHVVNINNEMSKSNIRLITIQINLLFFICVCFYSSFVCISAYANVYFKTTIIKQNIKIILISGVPSRQALSGFLIIAPPSVCVPTVLGALAMWIRNKKQKQKTGNRNREQLVPECVLCEQGTGTVNIYGTSRPARPPEVKILRLQAQFFSS